MKLENDRTYRVFHMLWYQGINAGSFITDLQVDEQKAYLVFQWTENHDGEYPSYRHEIAPRLLVPAKEQSHDFLIEAPVEIPESPTLTKIVEEAKHRR